MFVVTADQVGSRRHGDHVPAALSELGELTRSGHGHRDFERTVGDEIQGVVSEASIVVAVIGALTRQGRWRIGVGVGPVDEPLPTSTRAGSGPAFVAARQAITRARTSPVDLALVVAARRRRGSVTPPRYRGEEDADVRIVEAVLWLLVATLARRTDAGWEVVGVRDSVDSNRAAAERLDVTPSAVSQRLSRASWQEGVRGAEAAAVLLGELDGRPRGRGRPR